MLTPMCRFAVRQARPGCPWFGKLWALGFLLLALFGFSVLTVHAQAVAGGHSDSPSISRIEQRLYWDETNRLELASVRQANFMAFNGLNRLPFRGKTAWIRLDIERAAGDNAPLQLRVVPPVFEKMVLYSPSPDQPDQWRATVVDPSSKFTTVPDSVHTQPKTLFLQVNYAFNSGLILFAGVPTELTAIDHQIDIATALLTATLAFFCMAMLKRTLFQFSWMSLFIGCFFIVGLSRYWLAFGYAHSLMGLDPETTRTSIAFFIHASHFFGACIFVLLAQEIFPKHRMVRWLWIWPLLFLMNLICGLWRPYLAVQIADPLMLLSVLTMMATMLFGLVQSPRNIAQWPAKLAFGMIIFITLIALNTSLEWNGYSAQLSPVQSTDSNWKALLIRSCIPLGVLSLANWIFERMRARRLKVVESSLFNAQTSLELESKRLHRQRNFTTMLAHELKNPLTASHMALSGIQQRLGAGDPALERAAKIKTSLLEIDAIIERCAEIDGYEQGQMPMAIHPFSIRQLMIGVKVSNLSERIYTLMRGIDEDAKLNSDMQYIKIILSNLLTNALKYSPPDSLIELEINGQSQSQSLTLKFTVSNEIGASGVPEADRVFERFYRAEAARHQSGAGLGLWLSQSLAHALSSEIVFAIDEGRVSFSFSLPMV